MARRSSAAYSRFQSRNNPALRNAASYVPEFHFRSFALIVLLPVLALAQDNYRQGQTLLDSRLWQEALDSFNKPADPGTDPEALLYWKAFTLAQLGRKSDAAAHLRTLRSGHPASRWLADGTALEAAMAKNARLQPEDALLKPVYQALGTSPDNAVTLIQGLLTEPHVPRLAGFVLANLAQIQTPKARKLLEELARGRSNPEVQRSALSVLGRADPQALLGLYPALGDPAKGYVQVVLSSARDKARLAQIARQEKSDDLRLRAYQMLLEAGGDPEAAAMVKAERSDRVRKLATEWMGGLQAGIETALRELKSPDWSTRQGAANMLARGGNPAIDPALSAAYRAEKNSQVKAAIIFTLSRRRSFGTMKLLARDEQDPDVARQMVRQLIESDEGLKSLLK